MGEINRIKEEELTLIEAIGTGSFGQVYKAKYKDKLVAVKFGDGTRKKDFAQEISLLSCLTHPNIVELYGASAGTRFFLVLELGVTNLGLYILTHEYSFDQIRGWALQIAEAMSYMHSKRIVHRDLKTANILLDKNNHIKLCDFGTAKKYDLTTVMTFVGTISYMAPELLREQPVSEKIDLYSYAIVLWEIITKQTPFSGWKPTQIIWFVAGENERLPIPEDCPPLFREIIQWCWQDDPLKRPQFKELLPRLAVVSLDDDHSKVEPPLADVQRKWNLTINGRMEELRQMGVIKELDFKKRDQELKEREEELRKREEKLTRVEEVLQEENKFEEARLLRRIKTLPTPKRSSKAMQVQTDLLASPLSPSPFSPSVPSPTPSPPS